MTEQEIASFLTPDEVTVYSRLLSRPDARLPVSVFATIADLRAELAEIHESACARSDHKHLDAIAARMNQMAETLRRARTRSRDPVFCAEIDAVLERESGAACDGKGGQAS